MADRKAASPSKESKVLYPELQANLIFLCRQERSKYGEQTQVEYSEQTHRDMFETWTHDQARGTFGESRQAEIPRSRPCDSLHDDEGLMAQEAIGTQKCSYEGEIFAHDNVNECTQGSSRGGLLDAGEIRAHKYRVDDNAASTRGDDRDTQGDVSGEYGDLSIEGTGQSGHESTEYGPGSEGSFKDFGLEMFPVRVEKSEKTNPSTAKKMQMVQELKWEHMCDVWHRLVWRLIFDRVVNDKKVHLAFHVT